MQRWASRQRGGYFFDEEIKNWLHFRAAICRGCDGKGLGWITVDIRECQHALYSPLEHRRGNVT